MRQRLMLLVLGAVGGALVGGVAWLVLDDDAAPASTGEDELSAWLLESEQEMLADLVETARLEVGWAAGCLWREDGDVTGIIFPPGPAVIENGVMPSGRRFTLLRSDAESKPSMTRLESDAYYCIEPVSTRDDVEGDI